MAPCSNSTPVRITRPKIAGATKIIPALQCGKASRHAAPSRTPPNPPRALRAAGQAFSGRMPNGAMLLVLVFSLLSLAHLAFPAAPASSRGADFNAYVEQQEGYFNNRINGWWQLATLAILICISFNTLVYMLGYALESQEVKNYAKAEFLQVIASSLMIFFAVDLIFLVSSGSQTVAGFDFMGDLLGTGASSISCTATSGGSFVLWRGDPQFGTGPIGAFKCKLQEKINAVDNAYDSVKNSNYWPEEQESICYYILGVPVWCGSWDLGLHKQVEEAHLLASKMTDVSVSLHAQYVLAEYMQKNMLTVFLPFGLVLRIFPFTRGLGGLFIALGVGFFFVWPTFFLLTDPTFIKVNNPPDSVQQQGVCFSGFRGSAVVMAGVVTPGASSQQSELAIAQGKDLVYQLTVGSVFYPFVALALTLIFVRAMTPLLGGDMGELMKMVSRLG